MCTDGGGGQGWGGVVQPEKELTNDTIRILLFFDNFAQRYIAYYMV
jgi:hypothetical protein